MRGADYCIASALSIVSWAGLTPALSRLFTTQDGLYSGPTTDREAPMMESLPGVLSVIPPAGEVVPVVFDSPHSGKAYPDDFGSVLPPGALRAAEDAFV